MSKDKLERPKYLGMYGSSRHSTPIHDDLKEGPAYCVLTPVERLVLLDFIRAYMRASKWDKQLPERGFVFTWEQCREPISEAAFYRAMKRLHEVGFCVAPPDIQEQRTGAPRRYAAYNAWEGYKPTAEEAKSLQRFEQAKAKRIRERKQRRAAFREGLAARRAHRECGDKTRTE